MERIAIVSDIHGNMTAWKAVLKDIRSRGLKRIFCLGDLVGKGPDPVQVVDLVRETCEQVIRGNWDELVAVNQDNENFTWQAKRLGKERLAYLESLPFSHQLELSGRTIRLVHASPQSVYHRVQPWDEIEKRLAMFDPPADEPELGMADVVGYGDVHNAYLQFMNGKMLFNAGSVGNPLDFTQASYCILEGENSNDRNTPFNLQFVRVPYDIEQEVEIAQQAQVPSLDFYIRELRTGVYRGLQTD
ncbi:MULTISPECIES: metallophosphoesterase family protein [unclassified Paenibacillus]|uniref:metallophosphoesterase family protein n=1 Tax=unclassified Paenibacillus TaxID=185978 RepID=UPI00090ED5AB|nr:MULTISPECIES: metallophosphoesterase family protein [unclassified Paenibacillus]SHN83498.1 phosphoesterase, MJ0936 family [Paenibacillus sp. ov031]SLK15059.1 phosphoesterase, MJ0936 family [Paenibacillus sp. RU5A]SOC73771.1 phosphoesterase, MJ0936 family [Paenibacillus sp. RU26A]SOC75950.1 phosphoesterase, MJ0936 family [Paenibacillus sp. RU5M]